MGRGLPQYKRNKVLRRYDRMCVVCGAEDDLTIDHIIPLAQGGTDRYDNLQVLCESCNLDKADQTMDEWLGCDELEGVSVTWK